MTKTLNEPPRLLADLRTLCLPTIAGHWRRLGEEALRQRQSHGEYLADLAALEVSHRREKRVARLISEARFPILKTLDGFDFRSQPAIEREQILQLCTGEFVGKAVNVVLLGGVGTGKTHLATALGLALCQRDLRVRFTTAAELTNTLVESRGESRLSRKLDQLSRYDAVIIDELGYVPFDKIGADLLFNFVTKVYEKRSLIVTTNLPFSRWNEVFLDATAAAAVIDRIVHHSVILKTEGESYRLGQARSSGRQRALQEEGKN